ncbi:MAG: protein-export chaperone SecB [Bacteroidia bacterium]|jgi:preprotein translocase subunit secB|nr:protein-export chaperone SecB [Bacteroidia bacterium]
MDKNMESGFHVSNLLLLESQFKRIDRVQFNEETFSNLDTKIGVAVDVHGNQITVTEEVTVSQEIDSVKQFTFFVKMVGVFERIGESPLTDGEKFGRVNGAAIIFPYIREHITALSLKAGLGPIILPPINFTCIQND